ncbi:prepilin peptidase [Marinomonas pollencensis]|uniref:Prepilin leader peptidase/N-methyltransferase n=1 Tax=Marinomonas pollencensis TaxID=491954 RepID=A0A3E0DSL6_9GAMM|nr:A24 family peptidase [Marinomonas pollencensis]REG85486.1 type 4 prepilin peptidase 1 [Marinomonas pollencensis]
MTTLLCWLAYAAVLLCLGSFAALYSIRWPALNLYLARQEAHELLSLSFKEHSPKSYIYGRSNCPHCGHILSWKETIPLFSYAYLKGKCRFCQTNISPYYWQIEVLFLLAGLPLLCLPLSLYELALNTIILTSLLCAAIIDYQHKIIPNECSALVIAASLALNMGSPLLDASVLGLLSGYAIVATLRGCYLYYYKKEGIGLGDAKLLAALGAWLYLESLFSILLYASLLGIFCSLLFSSKGQQTIPFGPFLVFSSIVYFYCSYL